jgi:hypothetical protein
MKKGIIYLAIIAYSTIMLKPVLPFLLDGVAHMFWYSKHMATVHYENGKFHVHKEVVDAAKDDQSPEKGSQSARAEQSSSEHFVISSSYHFSITPILPQHFPGLPESLLSNPLSGDYPPPRV